MIHTPLVHALEFQEIIIRDFSITPADIRRTLMKQLNSNRLFASTCAYHLARMVYRIGSTKAYEYLGLFYGDISPVRKTIPDPVTYHDIVSGKEKTTSIRNMFWWARVRNDPPIPISAPPKTRQSVRVSITLTPTVSATTGFSPTVLIFNPTLVL